MKIIVGLGNPSKQYENTRHSLGFELIDALSKKLGVSFKEDKSLKSQIAKAKYSGEDIVIVKPQTFMNNSGEAVSKVASFYKVDFDEVIVACDDTYLEPGVVRIRFGGSSGGHNGLKSVILVLGEQFWRVRLGIGPNEQIPLEDYVLAKVPADQRKLLSEMIDKAVEQVVMFISEKKFKNKTI